jgi:hypothetical protein
MSHPFPLRDRVSVITERSVSHKNMINFNVCHSTREIFNMNVCCLRGSRSENFLLTIWTHVECIQSNPWVDNHIKIKISNYVAKIFGILFLSIML